MCLLGFISTLQALLQGSSSHSLFQPCASKHCLEKRSFALANTLVPCSAFAYLFCFPFRWVLLLSCLPWVACDHTTQIYLIPSVAIFSRGSSLLSRWQQVALFGKRKAGRVKVLGVKLLATPTRTENRVEHLQEPEQLSVPLSSFPMKERNQFLFIAIFPLGN